MKKFLITLFIFGFALVVICGIGLYAQGEKLEKKIATTKMGRYLKE